jgi:hypothetical protein
MDFEEIKKLLELGGGRCAVYREGEPGYVILNASEFQKLLGKREETSHFSQNDVPDGRIADRTDEEDFQDFQIEDNSLDAVKIEDLPL